MYRDGQYETEVTVTALRRRRKQKISEHIVHNISYTENQEKMHVV
jgi:hypothetical protein